VTHPTAPQSFSEQPWRATAAAVVEELFPVSAQSAWDDLLDLRMKLLHERDWAEVLETFLTCRRQLEEDHYLPFYRLRRILVSHLQLENDGISLARLMRKRNFSFRKWQQVTQKRGAPFRGLREVSAI
jgi:hypothetical protein